MTVGIIGAGPAGMSAALWLSRLGIDVLLVERESRLGGLQRFNFLENHWILGESGKTGPMLAAAFEDHIRSIGIAPMISAEVRSITHQGDGFNLGIRSLQGDSEHFVSFIVLAVGTRFRSKEVLEDVANLECVDTARLIYGPYAFEDLQRYSGKRLLIVGAGDNAHEFVRLTAEIADSFIVLARSECKAQQRLRASIDDLIEQGRCVVAEKASLAAVTQSASGLQVEITGDRNWLAEVDFIVVLAGYEPNFHRLDPIFSPDLRTQLIQDDQGYLVTDNHGLTTCPGIYAAGDITNPPVPCVVTALASGAVVARSIELEFRRKPV